MNIDRIHAKEDAAAEAELDVIIAEHTEPLEQAVLEAERDAGAAMTQLASKTNEWAEKEADYLRRLAEATAGTTPPQRPTIGKVGERTRITTPGVVAGKNIVGWVDVATNEFVLDDFQLDVSTIGPGVAAGIAVDTRYAVMGKIHIRNGLISSSRPTNLVNGVTGGNMILENLDISHVVDGVNAHSGSFIALHLNVHDLSQFSTDPRWPNGTHTDGIAFGTGILDVLLDDVTIDAGNRGEAESLSGLMFSPGVPRSFHAYRLNLTGGHPPINMAATSNLADFLIVDSVIGPGPVGKFRESNGVEVEWSGESVIARPAQQDLIRKGLIRTVRPDGSPITFMRG